MSAEIKKQMQEDDVTDSELEMDEQNNSDDSEFDLDDDGKITLCPNFAKRIAYQQLVPEERKKLANMIVNLRHEVPPQHRIEKTAGTRALKTAEREEFEKYVNLKIGTYSESEDKIIIRNWKAFCRMHDWDPKNVKPFLQMKYRNKEFFLSLRNRIRFVRFIADGLYNRSLYSVYNRFKVMFDPHKVSRYSHTEDDIILEFMRKNNNSNIKDRKFADLALILKRTRASVWRRFRLIQRKMQEKDVSNCC